MRWILLPILVGALASPAQAAHKPPVRPDLTVSAGTITAASTALVGSFTVTDHYKSAPKTSAALIATSSGGTRIVVAHFKIKALPKGKSIPVTVTTPLTLGPGSYTIQACADTGHKLRERHENNNCRTLGRVLRAVDNIPAPKATPTPAPTATATATAQPTPAPTASPTPAPTGGPLSAPDTTYTADKVFQQDNYYAYVPASYKRDHSVPFELFVWLHGCEGASSDDIYSVADYWEDEDYIAITPVGKEDADRCWDLTAGPQTILDAIANVETHFNINPRKVILGGYSSGGDLAYRTAFYNANHFAGILVENTSPFRDTGSTQQQSLAAASWKFNIVHLAHLQDKTYPYDGVKSETDAVKDAGFPITVLTRDGGHADDNTYPDLQNVLIPYLNNSWLSPP